MKKAVLWVIMGSIFLVIFNTFFFLLGGTEHTASVWISYGFIHFAYIMLLLTPILTRKGKSKAILGLALYSISSAYFLLEFVVGIVFILISLESINAPLLTQMSIAGIYAVILISNMLANEHTAEAEEKRQLEIDYVKNASAKLKSMVDSVKDKGSSKKIEKVYDAINSSPVKSHPNLSQIEAQILTQINVLEDMVYMGNNDGIISLTDSLLIAVNERNRQLKVLN